MVCFTDQWSFRCESVSVNGLPCPADHPLRFRPNFSFNFNFFLHGDNKVCASVDVQRHRYIYNLTNKDLERTSSFNGKCDVRDRRRSARSILVILAPYGISGMLIGHVSREMDLNVLRENWEKNYPIRRIDGLPDFVEVTAGRHRPEDETFDLSVCVIRRQYSDVLPELLCI